MSAPSVEPVIGIIGGSGLEDVDGLEDKVWRRVATPWGDPSDALLEGRLEGVRCVFLPRHGRGHRLAPGDVNYRANIDALKRAGCTEVISLSAVGSLRADLPPGHFVIVDQFIDRSFAREKSFFGAGCVAHVAMGQPVCRRLGEELEGACRALDLPVARGGTYLVMEGPQFSTLAESELYRSLGMQRRRHDQHAGGQARPRGGALLRHGGDGDRLRLLASRPRPCERRDGGESAAP